MTEFNNFYILINEQVPTFLRPSISHLAIDAKASSHAV